MIGKWNENWIVLYISTEHENHMIEFLNKRNKVKTKLLPIAKYNAFMTGFDWADQLMNYYPLEHKMIRSYKKIFIHIQ